MRLIDADALEYHEIDEVGGEYNPYLGCSKEYIDRQPTVCVKKNNETFMRYSYAYGKTDALEQVRDEIKKVYNEEKDIDVRWSQGLKYSLQIIDRYMKRKG